jgi:hypothetical protein
VSRTGADARARADEELGKRSVVTRRGVDVGLDLGETQVVDLARLERQRGDRGARISRHQTLSYRLVEGDR